MNRTLSHRCLVSTHVLARGWCGGGGGSGPVALAWATPAWLICAGFAATKPSALISSGGGRSNAWARRWLGRRTVCATLSVTRSSPGLLRSLTCLLVPFCLVVLIGPRCLDDVQAPLSGLYVEGDRSLLRHIHARTAIAVVGTSSSSDHSLAMAEELGRGLAEAGWPVLSGLAEGIDAAAHRGCLARNGAPIKVLGTPLDRVYPAQHRSLQQQVGRQGLLISPSRSGCRVRPGHFAARNRWLVAFAQALVVVECPQRSGALISARWASLLQCPVWVVPGDARRWSCRGSNALLRDGATSLIHPEDLLASIGEGPLKSEESRGKHQRGGHWLRGDL